MERTCSSGFTKGRRSMPILHFHRLNPTALDAHTYLKYVRTSLLLGFLAGCPLLPLTAQEVSPVRIMNAIKGVRGVALADTTPIDYCGSDWFWTATGELVDDGGRLPPARVRTRDACASRTHSAPQETPGVRINVVEIHTDSVVVYGATRTWMGVRGEVYVFNRQFDRIQFREFRITQFYSREVTPSGVP